MHCIVYKSIGDELLAESLSSISLLLSIYKVLVHLIATEYNLSNRFHLWWQAGDHICLRWERAKKKLLTLKSSFQE